MKENLVKLNLHCGIGCVPVLDIEKFSGEIYSGDRVLNERREGNVFKITEGNSSKIGEIWMTMKEGEVSWNVYCIMRESTEENEMAEKLKLMHGALEKVVRMSVEKISAALKSFAIPEKDDCIKMIENSMPDRKRAGEYEVNKNDLKKTIIEKVLSKAGGASVEPGCDINDFSSYCRNSAENSVDGIINGISVIRKSDDKLYFIEKNQYNSLTDSISSMIYENSRRIYFSK